MSTVTSGRLTNEGDDSSGSPASGPEDDVLARSVQQGNQDSLGVLYNRYVAEVYRYAYRQVGNREDAEDLTSQVFLQVVRSIGSYQPQGHFRAWVYGVAKNVIVEWWRRYYWTPTLPLEKFLELEPMVERAPAPADGKAEASVERLLARLPDRYREVLSLRFLRGYSLEETAQAMGVTVANAKVLQHRAVKKAAELGLGE